MSEMPLSKEEKGFKVVGYYPDWEPEKHDRVRYDVLTHIIYSFAIPNVDGTIKSLDHPDNAVTLIKTAHKNNVKVSIAIGGWEYKEKSLEPIFKEATDTKEKTDKLVSSLMIMVDQYGFDGVDVDWEHPRIADGSAEQYLEFLKCLRVELDKRNLILTSAVLSGVDCDGKVMTDAASHTDEVIKIVDWLNIMAYDGGDGKDHSSYEFAVNCGNYWGKTRNAGKKFALGVPFYGRPSWCSYDAIVEVNPKAHGTDISEINDMKAHYNGADTILRKTEWAQENAGGIMIWEISQDCLDKNKSLLNVIGNALK